MAWISLALALLLAVPAASEPFTIAIIGDTQNGTKCDEPDSAWEHLEASVQWVVNKGLGEIAYAVFVGDMIHGRAFNPDCWCAAQPSVPDCTVLQNPYDLTYCSAGECGDTQAAACLGGWGYGDEGNGRYCEWSRARALANMLGEVGIPWGMVAGNHDGGTEFDEYNSFFGAGKMSSGVLESGHHTAVVAGRNMSTSFYHVFSAGGAEWLIIGVGMLPVDMPASTDRWVHEVIQSHDGIPTILLTHQMIDRVGACSGAVGTYWCGRVGTKVYEDWATDPQVFLALGGHVRDVVHVSTTVPSGEKLVGMAVDWSFRLDTVPAPPAWQDSGVTPDSGPHNAGGGVMALLTIDPVAGVMYMTNWSEEEGEADERYEDNGDTTQATFWRELMPMCGSGRFVLPAEACRGYRLPEVPASGVAGAGR